MTYLYKNSMQALMLLCLSLFILSACATIKTTSDNAHIEQGKRYMEEGYYKRAMQQLLGPACDGNASAQYAVGYLYYYGYGVAQDTDVGYFWIKRAANQGYGKAIEAVRLIEKQDNKFRPRDRYR